MTNKERSFQMGRIFFQMDLKERRKKENVEYGIQERVSSSLKPHGKATEKMVGGASK